MDAMQRFNRISAVICLLLSCAPSAYAQDNLYGETMGAAVPQAKLAGVYPHGHSGLQDPAKALAGFHRASLRYALSAPIRGSGGASGAIIPKQLEHIQLYVLQYILRYNREVVFFSAMVLLKLHGNCSTRSTALK